MPVVGGSNSIDIEIHENVDNAIKNNQKFLEEMDRNKREFKAQQQAMDETAKVSASAAKTSSMSWTDFRSMYSTVLDVVKVGQAVWEEFGQKFVDNAVAVGDMARMMGTTTEEASRLKEVADDVGIEFGSVARAMKLAAKDGVEPNIESLAKLSDEYNLLAPGVERTQFLLDKFGRSGDEMGKLLEKGGDGIRSMSAAMDENLIVTEDAYNQAREYQVSVDALKDSWDAFTYKAAPPMVEALTSVLNAQRDGIRAQEILKEQGLQGIQIYDKRYEAARKLAQGEREEADAAILAKESAEGADGAFLSEADAAKALADEAKAAADAVQAISKANTEYLSLVGKLSDDMETNKNKLASLTDEHTKLLEQKKLLISQGYSEEGKTIQDVNAKIDENAQKQSDLADAVELANRRMILSMLEKQLATDGLSEVEAAYLLDTGLKWGVYSEEAVAAAKAAQIEVANLTAALNNTPTEKNITISTYYQQYGDIGNAAQTQAGGYGYQHAAGGSFEIPQSYGNEGFQMGRGGDTASAGEQLQIIPKGQSANGDMTAVISAINGNRIDENRLARAIVTAMKRGE